MAVLLLHSFLPLTQLAHRSPYYAGQMASSGKLGRLVSEPR